MARMKRAVHSVDEAEILRNIGPIHGNETKYYFAIRLNDEMLKQGITQQELCADTGIADGSLSSYRNGKSEPKASNISLIAKRLKVSTDYLLGLAEDRTTDKDERGVIDYTGISEDAVRVLNENKNTVFSKHLINDTVSTLLEDVMDMAMTSQPILTSISSFLNFEATNDKERIIVHQDGTTILPGGDPTSPYTQYLKEKGIAPDDNTFDILKSMGCAVITRAELENIFLIEIQNNLKSMKKIMAHYKKGGK